jgi:hypothetical protein
MAIQAWMCLLFMHSTARFGLPYSLRFADVSSTVVVAGHPRCFVSLEQHDVRLSAGWRGDGRCQEAAPGCRGSRRRSSSWPGTACSCPATAACDGRAAATAANGACSTSASPTATTSASYWQWIRSKLRAHNQHQPSVPVAAASAAPANLPPKSGTPPRQQGMRPHQHAQLTPAAPQPLPLPLSVLAAAAAAASAPTGAACTAQPALSTASQLEAAQQLRRARQGDSEPVHSITLALAAAAAHDRMPGDGRTGRSGRGQDTSGSRAPGRTTRSRALADAAKRKAAASAAQVQDVPWSGWFCKW